MVNALFYVLQSPEFTIFVAGWAGVFFALILAEL